MAISVALTALLVLGATRSRRLVPTRLQSVAELSYEFVANMIRTTAGEEGMRFFPLVYSLFMFILVSNVIGLIRYTFTVASQIIITVVLALLVFFTVIIYGFYKNGLGFLRLFVPTGVPIYILPWSYSSNSCLFVAPDLAQREIVRQHAGWPYHAERFCELRHHVGRIRCCRMGRRRAAARAYRHAYRARTPRGIPAGLRVRYSHVHLSWRSNTPAPLNSRSHARKVRAIQG
jgi:hypothetical protein